jgi:hypothetical protein
MKTDLSAILVLQDGFSLHRIVSNLPSDPGSIFVLLLVAVAVGWVAWGNLKKGKRS